MTTVNRRPAAAELDAAEALLRRLAAEHGIHGLRHGDEPGEVVGDLDAGRTYFDVAAFEDGIEAQIGWRPELVVASAPGAGPGRVIGAAGTHAA
jgi:hypothetical protein